VALAMAVAFPAEARARKKRKPAALASRMRPEDDPRKRGNHRAFAKASIAFAAPKDLSALGDGAVEIRLVVKGYRVGALHPGGPVPHVHLIVDNEPALEIDDAQAAWALGGLAPGPHLLRAVLCRPWHEVVKARRAFAMTRFWVGPRLAGKAGRAAESAVWPAPRKPILTYVLPVGPAPANLVLAPIEEAAPHDSSGPADPTAAWLKPSPNRPVLDFYLTNGKLGRRGDKILIVLDRRELPLVTDWKPHPLRRAHKGTRRISIDLLNRKGLKVHNAVNQTDRVFTVSR
jgi:hypothetical protein